MSFINLRHRKQNADPEHIQGWESLESIQGSKYMEDSDNIAPSPSEGDDETKMKKKKKKKKKKKEKSNPSFSSSSEMNKFCSSSYNNLESDQKLHSEAPSPTALESDQKTCSKNPSANKENKETSKEKKKKSFSSPDTPSSSSSSTILEPSEQKPPPNSTSISNSYCDEEKSHLSKSSKKPSKRSRGCSGWGCIDMCCWLIGYICCVWWILLVLYKSLPSLSEAITGPLPHPPGVKLKNEGLRALHPVVFIPGIVTGGLELWEGQPCADELFRKRLWGGTFGDIYKRPFCWIEHMILDNVTGLDPPGVRVRPVSGLVAADYFAAGYFVWAVLIHNLAKIGYEEKNLHMAAYDWRLSFQNTEYRDKTLSRLKSTIELLVETNGGKKVVAVPHSMGALYFMHFMKWVEAPAPMGGGGGSDWCAKHIKSVMNIGGPLLGVPKAVSGLFSAEAKDIAVARAVAPGVLDSELFAVQTLQHIMRVSRTWDSTMSMIPKGGEVIWGGVDWSPEDGFQCLPKKNGNNNGFTEKISIRLHNPNKTKTHYGRMISFGKIVSERPSDMLEVERKHFKYVRNGVPIKDSTNRSCGDAWTEYHEMSLEDIHVVAEHEVYTADTIPDLLRYVAPKMMMRGDAQFSHGLANDLDDPKYQHFKYWSNPLETRLPNAPDMEIYCMYGVGILTERSYVYKLSPLAETCYIPFRINTMANGDNGDHLGCMRGGTLFVDGDETVPVLSAGLMCAKGWRGKTRFNPSGLSTFVREYNHAPPSNLLEGRGTQSGSHVDIMGNFALIEDVMRVAAGASGEDIGGDEIYSDILKWAERVPLKL